MNQKTLLLIGALPPPIGGTSISFELLCDYLASRARCCVYDVNIVRNGSLSSRTRSFVKLIYCIKNSDVVSFHLSDRATILFGPMIFLFTRMFRKKLIYRQFGGEFIDTFKSKCFVVRYILRKSVLSADLVLMQTKEMVSYFSSIAPKNNVQWLPTSRPTAPPEYRTVRAITEGLKAVYIGQVHARKGIRELVAACKADPLIILDIYGPIFDDIDEAELVHSNISYKGIVNNRDVYSILNNYDVFVMPSYHEGEGYPGSLIEALSVGLPVITTYWRSLPELVDDTCGMLVEPGDANELKQALTELAASPKRYSCLSEGALIRAESFNLEKISQVFLEYAN